jgi:hypothetical protein
MPRDTSPLIFARATARLLDSGGGNVAVPPPPPPAEPEPSPREDRFSLIFEALGAAKTLFDRVFAKLDELEKRRAAAHGRDGRDGVGIDHMAIDDAGDLIVTLTDGSMTNAGRARGKDGAPAPAPTQIIAERDPETNQTIYKLK